MGNRDRRIAMTQLNWKTGKFHVQWEALFQRNEIVWVIEDDSWCSLTSVCAHLNVCICAQRCTHRPHSCPHRKWQPLLSIKDSLGKEERVNQSQDLVQGWAVGLEIPSTLKEDTPELSTLLKSASLSSGWHFGGFDLLCVVCVLDFCPKWGVFLNAF